MAGNTGPLGGVYVITCLPTGEAYVGSSINIASRLSQHRCLLRAGVHENKRLQRAWNTHSEDSFVFQVWEHVHDRRLLAEAEALAIRALRSDEPSRGFNRNSRNSTARWQDKYAP